MQVGSCILVRNRREIRQTVRAIYFNNSLVKILIERDSAARCNSSQTDTSPSVGRARERKRGRMTPEFSRSPLYGAREARARISEIAGRGSRLVSWHYSPRPANCSSSTSWLKPAPRVRRKSREWVTQLDEPPLLSASHRCPSS